MGRYARVLPYREKGQKDFEKTGNNTERESFAKIEGNL